MSASASTYLKSFFHQLSEVVGELTEMSLIRSMNT